MSRRLRKGLELVDEVEGSGAPIGPGRRCRVRLRLWLNRGEPVRWQTLQGAFATAELSDDGTTLVAQVRMDRSSLINGLYYGMLGMRIGGRRRLRIAPQLAYGERGVPGLIPPDALLVVEVELLSEQGR